MCRPRLGRSGGGSVNAAWQTDTLRWLSVVFARLADRSGAKQFTKTLCFWRVGGGLAACDRLVEGEVSQEGDIQENMLGKHCIY